MHFSIHFSAKSIFKHSFKNDISRNQYIDLMNMSRSSKRFGFFRRSGKELLPVEPVKDITILPWWIVQLGFVTEEDMKLADKAEV